MFSNGHMLSILTQGSNYYVLSVFCETFVTCFVFNYLLSYGIGNHDEITFVKKLRNEGRGKRNK